MSFDVILIWFHILEKRWIAQVSVYSYRVEYIVVCKKQAL